MAKKKWMVLDPSYKLEVKDKNGNICEVLWLKDMPTPEQESALNEHVGRKFGGQND